MGFLDTFKSKLFLKQIFKKTVERKIEILPINKYHSVLIVVNTLDSNLESHLKKTFDKAKFTFLTTRADKENHSTENNIYTFHVSDLGFGKVKSEKLIGLLHTNFDLVIDFTTKTSALDYFIKKSISTLKIGALHSTKNYLYDLLIEFKNSDINFINNIKSQINILS